MSTAEQSGDPVWLFAYGSLIWRPDIPVLDERPAQARGWMRRFWQGSHDHRGTPSAPGRVVTLVAQADQVCEGVAYQLDQSVIRQTFEALDHREKNGYERAIVTLQGSEGLSFDAVTYLAPPDNFAWLGDAPIDQMAAQIAHSHGPSGANRDYLFGLAEALRARRVLDEHVFELDSAVRQII